MLSRSMLINLLLFWSLIFVQCVKRVPPQYPNPFPDYLFQSAFVLFSEVSSLANTAICQDVNNSKATIKKNPSVRYLAWHQKISVSLSSGDGSGLSLWRCLCYLSSEDCCQSLFFNTCIRAHSFNFCCFINNWVGLCSVLSKVNNQPFCLPNI